MRDHRFNPAPFCAKCSGPCRMSADDADDDAIYRTVFTVEVFSRGPYNEGIGDLLKQIDDDITEGPCIGDVRRTSTEVVPADKVQAEMERIGNDGSFFDEEPDLTILPDMEDL